MEEGKIKLFGTKRTNKKVMKNMLRNRQYVFNYISEMQPLEWSKGRYQIVLDVIIPDKTVRGAEYEENKLMYDRYFRTGRAQRRYSGKN